MTTLTAPTPVEPPATAPSRAFRGDIDGLRAVAILLVVLFHVGLPGFSGGFIGVDVFFVISGYLITRNLLTETTRTGGVALLTFWAKRMRRLVPALALMVAVVLVLSMLALNALDWATVATQGRAAMLYVSNIFFAREAVDYFGGDLDTSLFIHTWSLGVEEQFYVLWPLLVGATALAVRRRPHLLRPALIGVFGVTLVLSLGWCVRLTSQASADAFFLLPSRAWEFAAAGLLAAVRVPRLFDRRAVRICASVAGIALLLFADLVLTSATLYPGLWALLPVTGTMLLINAGTGPAGHDLTNPITRVLATAPMQWLGRVSYSWYLWHWPIMLLLVAQLGHGRRTVRLAGALLALPIAVAAYTFVENRFRFGRRFVESKPWTFGMAVALTAAVVLMTVGLGALSNRELSAIAATAAPPGAGGAAQPISGGVTLAEVRAGRKDDSCARPSKTGSGADYCLDGDLAGTTTVLLVGDSHAGHWQAAFTAAAKEEGIRLLVRWQGRCPSIDVRVSDKEERSVEDPACPAFRAGTADLIRELAPDAIVTSNSSTYLGALLDGGSDPAGLWRAQYRSWLTGIRDSGIRVGGVVDAPNLRYDPLDCIAEKGVEACASPRKDATNAQRPYIEAERSVEAELGDVPVLDITPVLCPTDTCPLVIDNEYVYSDKGHLYRGFTLTQVPAVREYLRAVIGG